MARRFNLIVLFILLSMTSQTAVVIPGALMPMATAAGGNSVTQDSVSVPISGTGGTGFTLTNVVSSQANRALVVLFGSGDNSLAPITSITSNQGGTFVLKALTNSASWGHAEIWVMTAPAVATHIITIEPDPDAWETFAGLAVSFYNVDQTTVTGQGAMAAGSSATPSTGSITIGTGGMVVGVIAGDSEASCTITAGTVFTTTPTLPILNIASDTSVSMGFRTTTGAISFSTANVQYAIVGVPLNAQ